MVEEGNLVEEIKVAGENLVAKVKELAHEGNVRRLRLKNGKGQTLIEIPLTVGVAGATVGVLAAPVLAAIGTIAALVADLRIEIERIE
jgi:hypothetical protein